MPRRIHVLPDPLANQIAAGEVVERPASIVKELIENALDAAATRVDIAIRAGGKTEIRVADNGCGMGRDDALLSLDRHATSKITSPADLRSVRTFGFRGEALPSIASVSRLTLETAEAGGIGTRVRVAAGRIQGVEECARQPGTTVIVRSLFLNVPARAKFLRSAAAETRAVADAVVSLALANISAAFHFESNGRVLADLPAAPELVTRVASLWGDETARGFIPIVHEAAGLAIAGLIERPDAALSGPRRVHLFVGGRPFQDRDLVFVVQRAYRTTVPHGARPSLLLYVTTVDGDVDVNVHPSKLEVRFRDRFAVEAALEQAVRSALGRLDSAATLDREPPLPQLRQPPVPQREPHNAGAGQLAFFVSASEPGAVTEAGDATAQQETTLEAVTVADVAIEPSPRPSLWQLHDAYILAETRTAMLIIDQHSAHERVMFEQIMRGFDDGGLASQRLLFPLTLRLTPAEYGAIEQLRSLFDQAGFEIEPFGGRTVIVHAAPNPHPYFDAQRCLRDMVADLAAGSELTRAAGNQHERIAMTFACKGAIKAGQRLTQLEMQKLFDALFATELPYHDVHGRPTIIRFSIDELERRFGRHG